MYWTALLFFLFFWSGTHRLHSLLRQQPSTEGFTGVQLVALKASSLPDEIKCTIRVGGVPPRILGLVTTIFPREDRKVCPTYTIL